MSLSRRVGRQALRLLAGTVSARLLDLAFYFLLARALGVVAFGQFTFALSFALLFNALGDLGISTVFTREVARAPERARELLTPCLTLKLALALIALPAVTATAHFGPGGHDDVGLVVPIVIGMLVNSAALPFDGLLRASGRAGRGGLNLIAQSVVALLVGLVLLVIHTGPSAGAWAYFAGSVTRVAAATWWSRDQWRTRPASGAFAAPHAFSDPWKLLRESAPLAVSAIFIAIYFRVDSVILRAIQGERAVGLYAGIYRMFETFVLLGGTLRSVLFPVMSRAADDPARSLGVLCRKSIRVHLLITIGIAVFFTLEAPAIVELVLGKAYSDAAAGLRILVWALPGAFMGDTLLFLLTAQRRQSLVTWAAGTTAVINVVLNMILVPRFSFLGASAATVASEWLSFAILFTLFRRTQRVHGLASVAWRPVVAGAALGVVLMAMASWTRGGAGLTATALTAALSYPLLLALLGAVGREDFELLRGLVPHLTRETEDVAS